MMTEITTVIACRERRGHEVMTWVGTLQCDGNVLYLDRDVGRISIWMCQTSSNCTYALYCARIILQLKKPLASYRTPIS